MRKLIYAALLVAALASPVQRTDVGKLRPVEVISVAQTAEGYTIRTDTGDLGKGVTLLDAYYDLKATAAGVIYLDTAEYLLQETQIDQMDVLRELLKPNVRVCAAEPGLPLEGSGRYLDIHQPQTHLKDSAAYQKLEILWEDGGRYHLE